MAEIFSVLGGFVAALPKIKEYVVMPIKNQFSCVFRYDKLIQSLRFQVGSLDNKRAGLQLQIDAARRNLQVIEPDVLEWLDIVEKIKKDSEKIVGAALKDQNGTCLNGKCPKPKFRYSKSRQAMNLTASVVELLEKFDKLRTISYPAPPMGIESIPPPSGTHEFESRKHIEEEIMACLKDDTIFMIGVCGMGGVGKTTMAKTICRRASEEKLFDEIVMTEGLGQDADQPKIQQQIAECLGLELTKEMVPNRARLLHNRLMGKNVLLVLDDVWRRLDLEELGIPSQSTNRGCKIILTTRNYRVCIESTMDAKKTLSLEILHDKEAFTLFQEKAGSVVDEPNLHEWAIGVAKECKGLPLALVTVGGALREQTNKAVWEDALLQLRCSAPTNIPGVLKDVYQPLQLSYNALESDEARYLFLLCCLFPEDSQIYPEDLVHYGIGLDIFSNIGNLRQARNRVYGLIEILKSRFLLMDARDDDDYPMVKMHDVIRDMAIWISSKDKHVFMVNHEMGLTEWPKKDSSEGYTCISVTLGQEIVIPECMNCPRLEALFLYFAYPTEKLKLPDRFFNRMRGLRLLSIYGVFPPSSLSLLTQLRALRLHYCGFKTISLIGGLVNLEILSLLGSYIEVLPDEIGALTKLKLLDLSNSDYLVKIVPGVISKLVQLEDLRLLDSPIEWEREEKGKERSNASLGEVFSLRNLNTLEIWIKDPQVIPQDIGHLQKLTRYSVIIGKTSGSFRRTYTDQKCMIINSLEIRNSFANSMSVLFSGAERLNLAGNGLEDVIDLLERQRFEKLKELRISSRLGKTKHLVNTIQQDVTLTSLHGGIFPVLRRLELRMMNDLEAIFHVPPTVGSFSKLEEIYLNNLPGLMYLWKCSNEKVCLSKLKRVEIAKCRNLKWVFPLSIAESLCQLERFEIKYCPNMEEVFFKDESGSEGSDSDMNLFTHIKFPKLNTMILCSLPKLSALCKVVDVFEFPSIKTLDIQEVSWNLTMFGRQKDLFKKEVVFTDLKDLRMSQIDVKILYREVPVGIFSGLHKLTIESCLHLRTLFSHDIFRNLTNLKELIVRSCLILEEIVENQEDEEKVLIPQLEFLHLLNLPKIRYFCTFKIELELHSLKDIIIKDCPLMERFAVESCTARMPNSIPRFFFCKEVTCDNLKALVLYNLRFASSIFSHETPIGSLNGLEILKIESCHSLKSLFAPRLFGEITNLKVLVVRDCTMLEVVLGEEEVDDEESREKKIIRKPELQTLELSNLPKLRGFSYMHGDLELPSLRTMTIYDCTEMKSTLSLGIGSLHMSKWVRIYGLSDFGFASRFFFNEHRQDENSLSNGSFMLFPDDLLFTWYPSISPFLVKGLSNVFFYDGWLQASGRFGIEKLFPDITYEIIFVMMLSKMLAYNNKLITVLAENEREEDMSDKPIEKWIEIVAGEFKTSSRQFGEIVFSINKNNHWGGVVLKCVHIRPKKRIP